MNTYLKEMQDKQLEAVKKEGKKSVALLYKWYIGWETN